MVQVRADLHIHTVLSPCSSLGMSPGRIVQEAQGKRLDIIGITDHNSTRQCAMVQRLASEKGIFTMMGAEITTREEIHCLAFFPDYPELEWFQEYLENHQPKIPDKERKFGYQVLVDENDMILEFIDHLLWTALDSSIDEVRQEVAGAGGIFIPAHIDRKANGIISQIGFIPGNQGFDALEISAGASESSIRSKFKIDENVTLIKSSDAHFPEQIGTGVTGFLVNEISFNEIRNALSNTGSKRTFIE